MSDTDPNAPVDPTPEPTPDPTPAPPPELTDGQLFSFEVFAKNRLKAATDAQTQANLEVTAATQGEATSNAALGARVNQKGGLGIIQGDTILVLLPDGNGAYHPITVANVTPAPVPV